MSERRYHSITIDKAKCDGRMRCMRACTTQAIRIRNGKAQIDQDRCIDCGECMRVCDKGAIRASTDLFVDISRFKHKVALASPVLYSQFARDVAVARIFAGLRRIGFDSVYDIATECEAVSVAIQEFIRDNKTPGPLISSFCPTVIRLIQVRYPELTDHIIPIGAPREIAAKRVKEAKAQELGLKEEEIAAVYLTPCPAKMVSIKDPTGRSKSDIDGAMAISDVYGPLMSAISELEPAQVSESDVPGGIGGLDWSLFGGVGRGDQAENMLVVSGIRDVIEMLDDLESRRLSGVDYISCFACEGGCIGGSFCVENVYVARANVIYLTAKYGRRFAYEDKYGHKRQQDLQEIRERYKKGAFTMDEKILPRPMKPLDPDIAHAILKMKEKERIFGELLQIDCGACGAPTCAAFAEDVVRGSAKLTDCIFKSRERVDELAGLYGQRARSAVANLAEGSGGDGKK
jgi:iron only hydrogenase large subunit-like protein